MSTSKIVDYGLAQSYDCRLMIDGDTAFFDPAETEANIKSAIEAIGSMSGHTVTVTEIIAARKWQFDFDFTVTTFFAASSSDVGYSNPAAIDMTDGTYTSVSSPAGLTAIENGKTVFIRFKMSSQSLNVFFSIGGPSDNIFYIAYYTSFGLYAGSAGNGGATNNGYATTSIDPSTDWHTIAVRLPPPVAPATEIDVGDMVIYYDCETVTPSGGGAGPILATGTDVCIGSASHIGATYPSAGYIDQIIVIDEDIGDSAVRLLNDFASPTGATAIMLKCDDGSGLTATDQTSNNNDFTLDAPVAPAVRWTTDTTETVITDNTPPATGNASQMIRRFRLARAR